jgi:hypothetical protein
MADDEMSQPLIVNATVTELFQFLEPDPKHQDTWVRSARTVALLHAVRRVYPDAVHEGIEADVQFI